MKKILFFIFTLVLFPIQSAIAFYPAQKANNSPYVVHFLPSQEFIPSLLLPNGNDLRPQAFKTPWCSGAVVHPHIVITDAHCVYNKEISPKAIIKPGWKVSYPGVEVGSNMEKASEIISSFHLSLNWYKNHDCPEVPIAPTPTCSPIGDIAALVIKDPLPVPSDLKIASIPEVENMRLNQSEIIGFGYGLTDKVPLDKTIPMIVNKYPIVNYSKIIPNVRNGGDVPKKYNGIWPNLVLHAEHKLGESSCSGDSGGPFYVKQNGFMYYIGTNAGTNWGMCTEVPVDPRRNLNDRAATWISILSYHYDVYEKALNYVNSNLLTLTSEIKPIPTPTQTIKPVATPTPIPSNTNIDIKLKKRQDAVRKLYAGKTCTKLMSTRTLYNIKFTCIKSGKRLVWDQGT